MRTITIILNYILIVIAWTFVLLSGTSFSCGIAYGCLGNTIWLTLGSFNIGFILMFITPTNRSFDIKFLKEFYKVQYTKKRNIIQMLLTGSISILLYSFLPMSNEQWRGFENIMVGVYNADVTTLALWRSLPLWYTTRFAYPILTSLGEDLLIKNQLVMNAWVLCYLIVCSMFAYSYISYRIYSLEEHSK